MAKPLYLTELLSGLANVSGGIENPQVYFEEPSGDLLPVGCVTTIETASGTVIVLAEHG